MRWPFVSRKRYNERVDRVAELYARWLATAAKLQTLELEHAKLQEAYELMSAMERTERFKRLKAEGLSAFKDDRIRGALGLLYRAEPSGVGKKAG